VEAWITSRLSIPALPYIIFIKGGVLCIRSAKNRRTKPW
jgi:hypothetical protein